MTVRERFRAKVGNYPAEVLEDAFKDAAYSPVEAEPRLRAINLEDCVEDFQDDALWNKSFKYALSTLYYSMSALFSGGSRSEQVGDVHSSLSGFSITKDDREYFRSMGDRLRLELGYEPEEDARPESCMFDASNLRTPKPARRWNC